ncbi:MAG: hypothetical protein JW751_10725 [Polyangiaceae bacterium]|nr:hypothetical protein [Polyangiaceae bacterium]
MKPPAALSVARWLFATIAPIVSACSSEPTAGTSSCPFSFVLCGEACVNLRTDAGNCGACGFPCGANQACVSSVCTAVSGDTCQEPLSDCSGSCVDLQSDLANCGSCGNACLAGQSCNAGACSCQEGFAACDGACIDVLTDPNNCGGCGATCVVGQNCINGACECSAGLAFCFSECVDLQGSSNNCGICGNVCQPGRVCSGGVCQSTCQEPTILCSGDCVILASDVNNCGACGTQCLVGQSCVEGVCTCDGGFLECRGECVPSDVNNCGACGNDCRANQTCENGVCVSPPTGGTGGTGGDATGGGSGLRTGGTSGLGGTPLGGGSSVRGGYHVHGEWKGNVWTAVDQAKVATISPANFSNLATDGPYCATGTAPVTSDWSAVAMIGFNVNQAQTEDAPPGTWTPTNLTSGGLVLNVTNSGTNTTFRAQIHGPNGDTVAEERWCANLTQFGQDVVIPWTSFNTDCWDNSGKTYAGEPLEAALVLVPGMGTSDANPVARAFDFCVNDIGPS